MLHGLVTLGALVVMWTAVGGTAWVASTTTDRLSLMAAGVAFAIGIVAAILATLFVALVLGEASQRDRAINKESR